MKEAHNRELPGQNTEVGPTTEDDVVQRSNSLLRRRWLGRAKGFDEARFARLIVTPAVIVIGGLLVYPLIYAVWLSLHRNQEELPQFARFLGLQNYFSLAHDTLFVSALTRTVFFTVITVSIGVLVALGLAQLLSRDFRGRSVARTLLLVPWAVPGVVNGIMWHFIYDSNWGILDTVLLDAHVINHRIEWLGTENGALGSVIFAELWKLLPFITLILLAAMQNVHVNLYRAARVDGANAWRQFTHITLPGIRSALGFVLIAQTMWSIKVFDSIYVLTQGGPANGTTTINYYGYMQTFDFLNVGYGATISVTIMLIVLVVTCAYMFFTPGGRSLVGIGRQ
jgi:ABC-type sugar transport system permease subunit